MDRKLKKWESPKIEKLAIAKTEGGSFPRLNEGESKLLNNQTLVGNARQS